MKTIEVINKTDLFISFGQEQETTVISPMHMGISTTVNIKPISKLCTIRCHNHKKFVIDIYGDNNVDSETTKNIFVIEYGKKRSYELKTAGNVYESCCKIPQLDN
jgi:hypothetical protein